MDNRADAREFLSTRRARLTPEAVGIVGGGRRRVPGLRRDEVALLAGVSVDYYTRLERGNLAGVSEGVLDAIARALEMDQAERDHLHDLARAAGPVRRRTPTGATARFPSPPVQRMLDAMVGAPAMITNTRMDLVAANRLGYALYSDMYQGSLRPANHSRFIFLDPRAHDLYPDWERAANVNVAILRRDAGRDPHDAGIAALVGELSIRSDEFRSRWAAHDVRRHYTGAKEFRHRAVGILELDFQAMELQDAPGHTMTVYTAATGSATDEGLRLLATWAATEDVVSRAADAVT
ncbi:transcriptional regulator [Clavibacter michiganensis]|uniref:Transcriptional regulator n=1 Tax=Clavibacter michiganensis TaxID=28447 RepID=A0A2S5VRI9_9MICO|nr:helix-turn-helix transcriptional regulator [Clavibacter michiganensis]PPF66040.1 transcriptional regulator [Clavibacter michiganensis]